MRRTPAQIAQRREDAKRRRLMSRQAKNVLAYRSLPRRYTYAKSSVVPGYTRTGGYYGRMRGPNAPELKFIDAQLALTAGVNVTVSSTFATGACCLIPQGDTESSRDGRQANIMSIYVKGFVGMVSGTATVAAANFYWFLILDTQANGAFPAASDIWTGSSSWELMRNLEYNDRFKILATKVVSLKAFAGVSGAYGGDVRPFNVFHKCNIPITWASTTGAITEIRQNNIIMAWGIDTTLGGTGAVALDGIVRVRFKG